MWQRIVRFIRDIFSTSKEEASPEPYKPVSRADIPPIRPVKVALIVGHTAKKKGARAYTGVLEYDFNKRVAHQVKDRLDKTGKYVTQVFERPEGGYHWAVKQVAKNVAEFGADFSLELHFNSFERVAYGCEVLVTNDSKHFHENVRLADLLTDMLANDFSLRQRGTVKYTDLDGSIEYGDGVKVLPYGKRGYHNLAYLHDAGVKHCLLVEPCFANLKSPESRAIFEGNGPLNYVNTLVKFIMSL